MSAQKRVQKELAECTTNPPAGMTVSLRSETDLFVWHVVLQGPPNTVYAGGQFGLVVTLPSDYPFKPPVVTFATRIYHPNVTNDSLGSICLAALKPENWKPASKLLGILEAVRNLLVEPQPDDPLEARIADEFRGNRKEFDKNARTYVARYAKSAPTFPDSSNGGSSSGSAAKS